MIECQEQRDEIHFFVRSSAVSFSQETVRYVSPSEIAALRKEYKKLYHLPSDQNKQCHKAVRYFAFKGLLDGLFSKAQFKAASEKGRLPEGYEIHHIVPLSCGGTNALCNLCLVPQEVHKQLHHYVWTPVHDRLAAKKEKTVFKVHLPQMPRVLSSSDRFLFMTEDEIRKYLKTVPHLTAPYLLKERRRLAQSVNDTGPISLYQLFKSGRCPI